MLVGLSINAPNVNLKCDHAFQRWPDNIMGSLLVSRQPELLAKLLSGQSRLLRLHMMFVFFPQQEV